MIVWNIFLINNFSDSVIYNQRMARKVQRPLWATLEWQSLIALYIVTLKGVLYSCLMDSNDPYWHLLHRFFYSTAGQEILRMASLQKNGFAEPPQKPFLPISNNPLLHMHLYIMNHTALPVFWAAGRQPSTSSCPPMQTSLFHGKSIKMVKY